MFTIYCSEVLGSTQPTEVSADVPAGYDPRMRKITCGNCSCYTVLTPRQLERLGKEAMELASLES